MTKFAAQPALLLSSLLSSLFLSNSLVAQNFPDELPNVIKADGSRIEREQNATEAKVILETEVTTSINIPEITLVPCQAEITLGYYQRNTIARVEIEIEHQACRVATGSLEIVTYTRNDEGASNQLVFPETWDQNGSNEVAFERDYQIGENVTLNRVRSRSVRCECMEKE